MPTTDGRRDAAGRAEEGTSGRLPGAAHIGAVHLQTAELQRSIDYYSDVLGLEVLTRKASTASMGVAMTGRVIAVLHEQRGVSPVPRPRSVRVVSLCHPVA